VQAFRGAARQLAHETENTILWSGEVEMAKASALYDEDFVRWTEEQAAALRRAKGSNLPLDWEYLAEEIESLGKSEVGPTGVAVADYADFAGIC
jgi:hypothetical protein